MCQFNIFWRIQIFNFQYSFNIFNPFISNRNRMRLFINFIVFPVFIRDNCIFLIFNFFSLVTSFKFFSNFCKSVIPLCSFFSSSRNNKRRSRFINQNRIYFIDNNIIMPTLNLLIKFSNHIISQIVKSKFIVSSISNITVICIFSLFWRNISNNNS